LLALFFDHLQVKSNNPTASAENKKPTASVGFIIFGGDGQFSSAIDTN
jgi:hypothetical protein